ncbi:HemK2/MTQ2 family protein methyltransferase [Thermococcus sp.]
MLHYRGLKLRLHPQVYEPAEDTFLLAENLDVREGDFALDMGTGTGIIALLMAKKAESVIGADINPTAVELARENAGLNGVENVEFRLSDLFEGIDEDEKFDLITFNAPYLPGKPEEPIDMALVGGERGREVLDKFIGEAGHYLRPGGRIQIVQSSITGVEETLEKLENAGFKAEVTAKKHLFFEDIVLIGARLIHGAG